MWRIATAGSPPQAYDALATRLQTPALVFFDCIFGSALSAGIVLVFVCATSLREYVRQVREEAIVQAQAEGGEAGAQRNDGDDWFLRALGDDAGGNAAAAGGNAAGGGNNNDNDAAAADLDELPFEELVGLRGPLLALLESAATVLASNCAFLTVCLALPFQLGRLTLTVIAALTAAAAAARAGADPTAAAQAAVADPAGALLGALKAGVQWAGAVVPGDIAQLVVNHLSRARADGGASDAAGGIDATEEALSEAATLLLGYLVLAAAAASYWAVATGVARNAALPAAGEDRAVDGIDLEGRVAAEVGAGRMAAEVGAGAPHAAVAPTDVAAGAGADVPAAAAAEQPYAEQLLHALRYGGTLCKVTTLLFIELGLFPLCCGWLLDLCTLPLLDARLEERVEFWLTAPVTCTNIHWLIGIVYMLHVSVGVGVLREVLRPGVLAFLRDPADPNYNPFRDLVEDSVAKHMRRVGFSALIYANLTLLVVHVPIQAALRLAPGMFPVQLRFSDPFSEVPADMLLFHLCVPFTIEHMRPRDAVKRAFKAFLLFTCRALGVAEQLLPLPQQEGGDAANGDAAGGEQAFRVDRADNWRLNGAQQQQQAGATAMSPPPSLYGLRIFGLLLVGLVSLDATVTAVLLVPMSVGRALFASLGLTMTHDAYAAGVGAYVIWGLCESVSRVARLAARQTMRGMAMEGAVWGMRLAACMVLLLAWGVLLPVLVGVLFELLVLVPLRVPLNENPVFFLAQDWALGLLFLKVWTRLVMLGLDAPQLLGGAQWRARLEAVRRDGVANLRPVFVLSSVIAPLVLSLLTALAAPYVGGKLVGGIVGAYSGAPDARTCERYAWAASGACVLTYAGFKRALAFLEGLHDSIRDEVYLTGQRLHNHGEQRPDEGRTARAAPAVAQSGATEPAGDSEEDGALTPRYRTRLQTRP